MPEPRVRACTPPRMAILVDCREVTLMPAVGRGPRIDVVHETDHLGPPTTITLGTVAQPGCPPIAPHIDERDRALAHVLVQADATAIHDADITPITSALVPLPADWTSPTLGKIPPGGVAPGEPLSPHCHDRPAEPGVQLATDPTALIAAINLGIASKKAERCRCVWYRHALDTWSTPKRMWICPAEQHDEAAGIGSCTFEQAPPPRGWLWRALDRAFGGGR